MDFSWPVNRAINDFISKDFYVGVPAILKYPTIDILADVLVLQHSCINRISNEHLDRSRLTWQIYHCKDIIGKASGILTKY